MSSSFSRLGVLKHLRIFIAAALLGSIFSLVSPLPASAVSGTYFAGSGSTSNFSAFFNFTAGEILTAFTYGRPH